MEIIAQELKELRTEAEKRGGPRRTFHEDPESGNAWDEYDRAVVELEPLTSDWMELIPLLDGGDTTVQTRCKKVVESSRNALGHLRKGARTTDVRPRLNWGHMVAGIHTPGSRRGELGIASILSVRDLRESHAPIQALDLLLDTAVFSEDLANHGFLDSEGWGLFVLNHACNEIRSMVASGTLGFPEYVRIEKALELIDQQFPKEGAAVLNTIVQIESFGPPDSSFPSRIENLFGSVKVEVCGPISPGWRFLFSERLMDVDALERLLTAARRSTQTNALNWAEARSVETELKDLLLASPTNGRADALLSLFRGLSNHRKSLAQLRLLRTAARFLATGEILKLEDPFGTHLQVSERTGGLRIWSIGLDGTNDGGLGEWDASKGKDIVLEVEKLHLPEEKK